jgi:hypothetical protein
MIFKVLLTRYLSTIGVPNSLISPCKFSTIKGYFSTGDRIRFASHNIAYQLKIFEVAVESPCKVSSLDIVYYMLPKQSINCSKNFSRKSREHVEWLEKLSIFTLSVFRPSRNNERLLLKIKYFCFSVLFQTEFPPSTSRS